MSRQNITDVVVVGMGGAGLSAALTAHRAGSEVIVLEKTTPEHAGGNSRVSGQVWFSPHDVDLARRHLHAMSHPYAVPDSVAAAWALETSHTTEWLREIAEQTRGRVPRDQGDPYPVDSVEFTEISWGDTLRMQGVDNPPEDEYQEIEGHDCGSNYHMLGGSMGHSRVWLMLRTALDDAGVEVRYGTEAVRLVVDSDEAVTGVVVRDGEGDEHILFARRGVILATGGFAANPDMTRNYLRLPNAQSWGSPACTGDGIRMAQTIGADLAHPGNYMSMPGIATPPYPAAQDAQPSGKRYITVRADGRRFVNEAMASRHGKATVGGTLDYFPGQPMWTVFDEDTRLAGPLSLPRKFFPVGWLRQMEDYEWSADNSAEIDRGWITRADTIRELADELGIDPDGLESEIQKFNDMAEQHADDPVFGRPAETMRPIISPPFYGYAWGQLLITTLGGIRKDENARAIDAGGTAIRRLYCAGDTASTYAWACSGGMGLSDALAFGRIAGRNAAAEPAVTPEPADANRA